MVGLCPRCLGICKLTKHHLFPKRYYRNKNAPIVWLCRYCHDDIEELIPFKKMRKHFYLELTIYFIRGV